MTSTAAILSPRAYASTRQITWLFATTTFAASALVFLVQPMSAKMLLPKLGGSAAVWNTCVLFFQTSLLLGYLYAHVTTRWLGERRQAIAHLILMMAALAFLPLTLGDGSPPAGSDPVWWLLVTMFTRLGLPFLTVATMAPLVQRWFATLPVPSAANPYFLYSASNIGSMMALLAYPLILEPFWGTQVHSEFWLAGYGALLVLTTACIVCVNRNGQDIAADVQRSAAVSWRRRAKWTMLACIPSSLMLGVTTHISTDLAAIPLLWVLPLAAYLLTFILAFSRLAWFPGRILARARPFLALAVMFSIAGQLHGPWFIPLHLVAFFAAALYCHATLVRARPGAEELTEFYVWISFGGMLGGVFNSLVAPHVFNGIFEYPIVLALACFVRVPATDSNGQLERRGRFNAQRVSPVVVLAVAVVLILAESTRSKRGELIFADRSFFGVARVSAGNGGASHLLHHGSTLHGQQNLPAGSSCEPQSYFHPAGPLGQLFRASGLSFADVAVVGLGSGSLACYASPGTKWTFFEIDPLIERIARDPGLFTFLQNTNGQVAVEIGDGRKKLEEAAPGSFDLIVIDAFSSDSVPVHLMTREAVDLYASRLRPGGIIALHISNRYVELEPVIAAIVAPTDLFALTKFDDVLPTADAARGRLPSHWVLLTAEADRLAPLGRQSGWRALSSRTGIRAWTDDYSNLLSSLRW
jgi:SAM-dependent methyltransferase